ncbi:MAG: MarR family transcriptional regulator [Clostridia bacterium]|nr:MarR family transcriptional regulator [Clostridia bacterium]
MQQKPLSDDFIEQLSTMRANKNYNAMMRICDASKLYHDRMRRQSELDGLPASYRPLLFHLSKLPPGSTQLELVRVSHLKPPTVSVTLQKMERDGLVIRRDNEHDLRQTLVYLSEKGKAINERIHHSHVEGDRIALAGLTDDEIDTLSGLLNKVIDNLIAAR